MADQFWDTLVNLMSGLGGPKDKSTYSQYIINYLTREQLEAAFRADWVARKVVTIPAADATREWRQWQAENDQIEALEEAEATYKLRIKVKRAITQARLYGGAALVLGVESGSADEELKIDQVGKGALKWVHAVSRWGLQAGPIELDIQSPWHGEPQYYIRRSSQTEQVKIHPSRVVRFLGNELPDDIMATADPGWGDSILQVVDDAVRASGRVAGGISALIEELKFDVIRIPGLTNSVSTQEGRDRVTTRLTYANTLKSVVNAIVLDKEEEWERIQANFANMSDLMREYFSLAAGACDIPVTRMLAQSPGGLNATGDSDTRNYYDMLASDQDTEYAARMEPLDNVLIRHLYGQDEPDIFYEWNPLWQMTDDELSQIAKRKADTFKIDNDAGLFPHMVMRDIRANQLIEDMTYPGLEAALEEADKLGLMSNEDPDAELELERKALLNQQLKSPPAANENAPPKKKAIGDAMIKRNRRRLRRLTTFKRQPKGE